MPWKRFFALTFGIALLTQRVVAAPATAEVRFVYLVPSDRPVSAVYPERILFAARHVQSWLTLKLDGRTFRLANSPVRIVRSDKPARWFGSTEGTAGFNGFYRKTLDELGRLGAGRLNDPEARTVVYVDADHACGQSGAGGNGVAIVSANDLRGISGEPIVPACSQANTAEIAGRCRWIGGMAHELLHTMGLIHPDRSPACQSPQCRSSALMMHGYITYPNATLLADDIAILNRTPFISAQSVGRLANCTGP